MSLRPRKSDLLLLGLVLALAALAAVISLLVMPPPREGSFYHRASSFFNESYGAKALLLCWQRLGLEVRQIRRPLGDGDLHQISGLVLLQPLSPLQLDEEEELLRWVRQGHVLLYCPGGERQSWLRVRPLHRDLGEKPQLQHVYLPAPGEGENADENDLVRSVRHVVCEDVARLSPLPIANPELAAAEIDILCQDKQGPILGRIRYGRGEILALAEAYPISNIGLGQGDNAILAANLAARLSLNGKGAIGIDEYHHGFAQRRSPYQAMGQLVLQSPWRWGLVQAGAAALLALWLGAVRLGRPVPVPAPLRRTHGEFAQAGAALLHEAGAFQLAAGKLLEHYRGCLQRLLHVPSGSDDQALGQQLGQALGQAQQEAWQAALAAAQNRALTGPQLLLLSQSLHQMTERLRRSR